MFVNFVFLVYLSIVCLFNGVCAQFSFDFMQAPISDTVKFNHEYDFIVIGAGSGWPQLLLSLIKITEISVINLKKLFFLFRWLCNGQQVK